MVMDKVEAGMEQVHRIKNCTDVRTSGMFRWTLASLLFLSECYLCCVIWLVEGMVKGCDLLPQKRPCS